MLARALRRSSTGCLHYAHSRRPIEAHLMTYLVDGNNVMGQRVGWHRDKAGARRRLLGELVHFARTTGEPVRVVFDGAPDAAAPDDSVQDGVRVYYAAQGSDADTRIAELVAGATD